MTAATFVAGSGSGGTLQRATSENISYFAFTATPKGKTLELFGREPSPGEYPVPFHVYTFVGSWPFCLLLTWIGMKLGNQWNSDPRLKAFFHRADLVIGVIIVAAAALFLWHRLRGMKRA